MTRRTRINLIAVGVAAVALVVLALTQLVASAVLDDTYPLSVRLPAASGLLANKEVTYNGHAVGAVREVMFTEDGTDVVALLAIDDGTEIPRDVDVAVLRRSAIGEQAVDIRPRSAEGPFYEAGDELQVGSLTLPPEVQEFFAAANDVLEPLDKEKTGALVAELADVVRGRREDIRGIIRSSGSFSEQVADNGGDYDRLFASSRVVNADLAGAREDLARFISTAADGSAILTDLRADYEALLADAPGTLALAGNLIERSQANLSCDIESLANFNSMTAEPVNLRNASEGLRLNRFFFEGFTTVTNPSPNGLMWQRVSLIAEPEPAAESYLPAKRPIRDILPGGACESPFGSGAGAATQSGYERRVPEARVVLADNGRTADVERGIGSTTTPTALDLSISSAPAAQAGVSSGGRGLPATGGSAVALLLGLVMLATGVRLFGGRRAGGGAR